MKQLKGEFSRDKEELVGPGGIRFPHHMYIELSKVIEGTFEIQGVKLISIACRLDVMFSTNHLYPSHQPIVDMSDVGEVGMIRDLIDRSGDERSDRWKDLW